MPYTKGIEGLSDYNAGSGQTVEVEMSDGDWPPHATITDVLLSPPAPVALAPPMVSNHKPTDVAELLEGAKPVSWRGRGDLIQLPWTTHLRGLLLVVDLWSGFAGTVFALLSLRVLC